MFNLTAAASAIEELIKFVASVHNKTAYYKDQSLAEVSKLTRVEPLAIFSRSASSYEGAQDISNCLLSMFSAYYLQAFYLNTQLRDIEVVKTLDRLNPDRDASALLYSQESFGLESAQFSLPGSFGYGIENEKTTSNVEKLNDITALSMGRLLHVTIPFTPTDEAGLPCKEMLTQMAIQVRLQASNLSDLSIINLLAAKTTDNDIVERYHLWRAGQISFIRDLILCQDMIDESHRAVINDDTGTLEEIYRRVANSRKYGLLTKNPSLATASNLYVFTEDITRNLEIKMGGKLKDQAIRKKVFEGTYAMILVEINRERDLVSFWIRGIDRPAVFTARELKAKGKGNGPDVADILKAMTQGNAPQF